MNLARIPLATYRLQLNRGFTLADATALVPYLHDLGVSDCYTSPYLKARPESTHGYDICDHNALNPAIGSEDDLGRFAAALGARSMGHILDVVPNHMGIDPDTNVWWRDVLENGPASPHARFFDIDWSPIKPELAGKVLLPILGDQYGAVLERGELRLEFAEGAFRLRYFEQTLPIAPCTYDRVLREPCERLATRFGADDPRVLELQSIATAIGHLPGRDETDPALLDERNREKEVIKRRLAQLVASAPEVQAEIDAALRRLNGTPGQPRSFDELDALLAAQPYRPSFWRVASEEINYRRFFDINDLAAIRMEDPVVFREAHRLIFRLLREGKVTGLRIDHPDGLRDPAQYFHRLQALGLTCGCPEVADAFPPFEHPRPFAPHSLPLYVVVEKILTKDEPLPDEWPVHGTTGYDFLNLAGGLFVDGANRKAFDDLYARFTGRRLDFHELVYHCKRLIMRVSLASEVEVLANQLRRIAERDRRSRDFTLNALREAVREVIACFPVYRTYITRAPVSDRDGAYIELAVAWARRRNPASEGSAYRFLRDTLLLVGDSDTPPTAGDAGGAAPSPRLDFVMKFQQVTGPVMAKAVEDTAFYSYNRLVALNEVGGDPEPFGVSVAAFHRANLSRLERWPHSMLATSTHDTKRSEDVRARIAVLSEMPREWSGAVNRWARLNRRRKRPVDGQLAPSRDDEYLLYQTLVGAWPIAGLDPVFVQRIQQYMAKATKEAKVHTSWINPNEAYDAAVQEFVAQILDRRLSAAFLEDFARLQAKVAHFGAINSLAQTVLKLTSPGVPDVYQGTELWDFSLVDPDNRRPVDFALRRRVLRDLRRAAGRRSRPALARSLWQTWADGRVKLFVTWRALTFRRQHARLFQRGLYRPLEAAGRLSEHVCAFARELDGERAVVAVPRLLSRVAPYPQAEPLGAVWGDTRLVVGPGPASYCDLLTGQRLRVGGSGSLPLATLFGHLPLALLALEHGA